MAFAVSITILASFLWGVTNYIDKFMINGINESGSSIKTLLVFSTLVAGIILSPIWLIMSNFSVAISVVSLICVILSAFIYILATYFYYKALEKNDTSIVVTMFQLIPVFSYIVALIFFDEKLMARQIIGSIIIILSAVLISFDFKEKNNNNRWIALILMILSSFFFSTYFFLFDIGIRNSQYNACAFWFQIGFLILGLIFICFKSFRISFIEALKTNGKRYIFLNITNQGINLIANLLVNFANVTIPLAIANVSNGFQGGFVFILGVILTKFLPQYFKEDLSRNTVIQKISCIALSILGLIVMYI